MQVAKEDKELHLIVYLDVLGRNPRNRDISTCTVVSQLLLQREFKEILSTGKGNKMYMAL